MPDGIVGIHGNRGNVMSVGYGFLHALCLATVTNPAEARTLFRQPLPVEALEECRRAMLCQLLAGGR